VVFRQSRGFKPYALWRDINSCIGSNITHNYKNKGNKAVEYTEIGTQIFEANLFYTFSISSIVQNV